MKMPIREWAIWSERSRCVDCKRFVKVGVVRCEPCWQRELRILIRRRKGAAKRRARWPTM